MGSKTGGGSDAQAAEQQRIRAEQDRAISELNALFGVGDPKAAGVNTVAASLPAASNSTLGRFASTASQMSASLADPRTPAQRAADVEKRRALLDANKAKREENYRTLGNDVMAARMPQLVKQRDQAERMLKDQLARNGQVGGSLALDQGAELTDNYGRGVLDMENQKEAAINTSRAQDEQTRIDLISRIRGGMDQGSALASAASQTQSNIAQTRDSALAQNLQDYFSGMGYLYGQNQQQNAYQQRMKQLGVSAPSASNGTVSATGG